MCAVRLCLLSCVCVYVCIHACVSVNVAVCLLLPLRAIWSPPPQWLSRWVAWCRAYLSHGCQEALRVEEACHPEAVGPPFKDPSLELPVPLKQLCEPKPQGAGGPRCLKNKDKQRHEQNITTQHRKLKSQWITGEDSVAREKERIQHCRIKKKKDNKAEQSGGKWAKRR